MSDDPTDKPTDPATPRALRLRGPSKSGSFYLDPPNDALQRHEIASLLQRMTLLEERLDRVLVRLEGRPVPAPRAARLEEVVLEGGDPRVEK